MKCSSVLYIDDDIDSALLVERLLRDRNIRFAHAGNGTEGLAMCESEPPNVVLLDIGLPGISGHVVLRRIKKFAQDNRVRIKVFMVTASNLKDDVEMALRFGADDYLTKPFAEEALLGRLARY